MAKLNKKDIIRMAKHYRRILKIWELMDDYKYLFDVKGVFLNELYKEVCSEMAYILNMIDSLETTKETDRLFFKYFDVEYEKFEGFEGFEQFYDEFLTLTKDIETVKKFIVLGEVPQ